MKVHVISTHDTKAKHYNISKTVLFNKNIRAIAKVKVNADNTVHSISTFKIDHRNVKKIGVGKTSKTMRITPKKEKVNTRFESISHDVKEFIQKRHFQI